MRLMVGLGLGGEGESESDESAESSSSEPDGGGLWKASESGRLLPSSMLLEGDESGLTPIGDGAPKSASRVAAEGLEVLAELIVLRLVEPPPSRSEAAACESSIALWRCLVSLGLMVGEAEAVGDGVGDGSTAMPPGMVVGVGVDERMADAELEAVGVSGEAVAASVEAAAEVVGVGVVVAAVMAASASRSSSSKKASSWRRISPASTVDRRTELEVERRSFESDCWRTRFWTVGCVGGCGATMRTVSARAERVNSSGLMATMLGEPGDEVIVARGDAVGVPAFESADEMAGLDVAAAAPPVDEDAAAAAAAASGVMYANVAAESSEDSPESSELDGELEDSDETASRDAMSTDSGVAPIEACKKVLS